MKKIRDLVLRAMAAAAVLSLAAFFLSGCIQDRAQTEKKILAHDPSFGTVLQKRDLLSAELGSLRAAFVKVRNTIDAQIAALRDKRARARREYEASAEKIKLQFQPELRKVERETIEAQRRYDQKSIELREVERGAREVSYLMKKKDKLILTEEEMKTWNERMADLSGKKKIILEEMARIKEELRIDKMKLRVMKLR